MNACRPFQDLTGQTFGKWIALEYLKHNKWKCICTGCGQERIVLGHSLTHGLSKQCRECFHKAHNQIHPGQVYGHWKVVGFSRYKKLKNSKFPGMRLFWCECQRCHKEYEVVIANLVTGASTQCQACFFKYDSRKIVPGVTRGFLKVLVRLSKNKVKWECLNCGSKYVTARAVFSDGAKNCIKCAGRLRIDSPTRRGARFFTVFGETHNMRQWADRTSVSRQRLHQIYLRCLQRGEAFEPYIEKYVREAQNETSTKKLHKMV